MVAAGIEAVSEGDFAADNNATKLSFLTGASEVAAEKASLSSDGILTVYGYIDSGTRLVETTTDVDITVDGSNAIYINNHASAIDYTLPAEPETASGNSKIFCFRNRQAQIISIVSAANDIIELQGTDGTGADTISSSDSAKGDFICFQGFDDGGVDTWVSWGVSGTWGIE